MRKLRHEHGPVERTEHEALVGAYLCLQQGIWHEEMYVRRLGRPVIRERRSP